MQVRKKEKTLNSFVNVNIKMYKKGKKETFLCHNCQTQKCVIKQNSDFYFVGILIMCKKNRTKLYSSSKSQSGALDENRTHDPMRRRHMLYPTELQGPINILTLFF